MFVGLTLSWGQCQVDTGSVSDLEMQTEDGPMHFPFLAAISGAAIKGSSSLDYPLCNGNIKNTQLKKSQVKDCM